MLAIAGQMTDIFWENDHGTIFFLQNWNSFLRNFFKITGIAEQLVDINIWILNIFCFYLENILITIPIIRSDPGINQESRVYKFSYFSQNFLHWRRFPPVRHSYRPTSELRYSVSEFNNVFCKSNPIYLKDCQHVFKRHPPLLLKKLHGRFTLYSEHLFLWASYKKVIAV